MSATRGDKTHQARASPPSRPSTSTVVQARPTRSSASNPLERVQPARARPSRSSASISLERVLHLTSVSSESVFGFNPHAQYGHGQPSQQFRPLSIMSEMSGEDLLASLRERSIFSKPAPAARSRSSTCTSSSSGAETPPLSASDGSLISGGSQSSIALGHLNTILTNITQPSSGVARARTRARARGMGHRRRIDQARMSRSSVYETIQEEASYALREEAQETVKESRRVWADTPFSIFAVQSFQPPKEPAVMQAMLEHSQKNYGPLPSELRPHRVRSRTSSRASPYPLRNMPQHAPKCVHPRSSTSISLECVLHLARASPPSSKRVQFLCCIAISYPHVGVFGAAVRAARYSWPARNTPQGLVLQQNLTVYRDMDSSMVVSFGKKVFRTCAVRHPLNPQTDDEMLFEARRYEVTATSSSRGSIGTSSRQTTTWF
ncbi:hypothetical protein OH77DRAFT_1519472 [Trametes cingulata]|nr:hypothetical protein OH77DRAFT_1519472 [Trametes cingulata]